MPEIAAIRDYFLSELEGSSEQTQKVRLFWCQKFLRHVRNKPLSEWNKSVVRSFIRSLQKEGYAPSTVQYAFGVTKRVFNAAQKVHEKNRVQMISSVNFAAIDVSDPTAVAQVMKSLGEMQQAASMPGPNWDLGKRSAPRVQKEDMKRPATEYESIVKMVGAARAGKLEVPQVAYLAIDTALGLRAGELRTIHQEHIDYDACTIWIDTEKDGEKRKCYLPPVLHPFIKPWDFHLEYSDYLIWKMFRDISSRSGVTLREHESWHAIRRYLETVIRDALASDPTVKRDAQLLTKIAFRYRLVSSSEMTDRYYSGKECEIDRLAWEHNPVIKLWE